MRKTLILAVTALGLAGGLALADQSANPTIAARQQVMKGIGGSMKVLGDMASGKTPFDAAAAKAAAATLAAESAKVKAAFQTNVTDADSKSSPKIWTDWADFAKDADTLATGAHQIDPSSLDRLKATLGAAGGTCRDCHSEFRS